MSGDLIVNSECHNPACLNLRKSAGALAGSMMRKEKVEERNQELKNSNEVLILKVAKLEDAVHDLNERLTTTTADLGSKLQDYERMKSEINGWKKKCEVLQESADEGMEHQRNSLEWEGKYKGLIGYTEKLSEKQSATQAKFVESVRIADECQKRMMELDKKIKTQKTDRDEERKKFKILSKYAPNAVQLIDDLLHVVPDHSMLPAQVRRRVDTFSRDDVRLIFGATPASVGASVVHDTAFESSFDNSMPAEHDEWHIVERDALGLTLSDDDDDDGAESPNKSKMIPVQPPRRKMILMAKKNQKKSDEPPKAPQQMTSDKPVAWKTVPTVRWQRSNNRYGFENVNNVAVKRTRIVIANQDVVTSSAASTSAEDVQKDKKFELKSRTIHGRKGQTVREQQAEMMKKQNVKEVAAMLKAKTVHGKEKDLGDQNPQKPVAAVEDPLSSSTDAGPGSGDSAVNVDHRSRKITVSEKVAALRASRARTAHEANLSTTTTRSSRARFNLSDSSSSESAQSSPCKDAQPFHRELEEKKPVFKVPDALPEENLRRTRRKSRNSVNLMYDLEMTPSPPPPRRRRSSTISDDDFHSLEKRYSPKNVATSAVVIQPVYSVIPAINEDEDVVPSSSQDECVNDSQELASPSRADQCAVEADGSVDVVDASQESFAVDEGSEQARSSMDADLVDPERGSLVKASPEKKKPVLRDPGVQTSSFLTIPVVTSLEPRVQIEKPSPVTSRRGTRQSLAKDSSATSVSSATTRREEGHEDQEAPKDTTKEHSPAKRLCISEDNTEQTCTSAPKVVRKLRNSKDTTQTQLKATPRTIEVEKMQIPPTEVTPGRGKRTTKAQETSDLGVSVGDAPNAFPSPPTQIRLIKKVSPQASTSVPTRVKGSTTVVAPRKRKRVDSSGERCDVKKAADKDTTSLQTSGNVAAISELPEDDNDEGIVDSTEPVNSVVPLMSAQSEDVTEAGISNPPAAKRGTASFPMPTISTKKGPKIIPAKNSTVVGVRAKKMSVEKATKSAPATRQVSTRKFKKEANIPKYEPRVSKLQKNTKSLLLQAFQIRADPDVVIRQMHGKLSDVEKMSADEVSDVMIEYLHKSPRNNMWSVVLNLKNKGDADGLVNMEERNFLSTAYAIPDCREEIWEHFLNKVFNIIATHNNLDSTQCGFLKIGEEEKAEFARLLIKLILAKNEQVVLVAVSYALMSLSWKCFEWISDEMESSDFSLLLRVLLMKNRQQGDVVRWLLRHRFDVAYLSPVSPEQIRTRLDAVFATVQTAFQGDRLPSDFVVVSLDDATDDQVIEVAGEMKCILQTVIVFTKTCDTEVLQFAVHHLRILVSQLERWICTSPSADEEKGLFVATVTTKKASFNDVLLAFATYKIVEAVFSGFVLHENYTKHVFDELISIAPLAHKIWSKFGEKFEENTEVSPLNKEQRRVVRISVDHLVKFIQKFTCYEL